MPVSQVELFGDRSVIAQICALKKRKQDALTAGSKIKIENNIISSTATKIYIGRAAPSPSLGEVGDFYIREVEE